MQAETEKKTRATIDAKLTNAGKPSFEVDGSGARYQARLGSARPSASRRRPDPARCFYPSGIAPEQPCSATRASRPLACDVVVVAVEAAVVAHRCGEDGVASFEIRHRVARRGCGRELRPCRRRAGSAH